MNGGFRRGGVIALAVFAVAAGAAWIVAGVRGVVAEPASADVDGFSASAIGHRAFYELLRDGGFRVRRSRFGTARQAGPGSLTIFLEPGDGDAVAEALSQPGATVLAALPKRALVKADDGWARQVRLRDVGDARGILREIAPTRDGVVRKAGPAPATWGDDLPPPPAVPAPQRLAPCGGTAVVDGPDGVLLARYDLGGSTLWVLADPDHVASHGLAVPGGASFAEAVVRAALPRPDASIVIDETEHGHVEQPGFWTRFGTPPLSWILVHAAVLFGLLTWAAAARFGPPIEDEPPSPEGRRALTGLTAELIAAAPGGPQAAAMRTAERRLRDAAAEAGADPAAPLPALAARLDAAAAARGLPLFTPAWRRLTAAEGRTARRRAEAITEAAAELAAWRKAWHGTRGRSHAR
ncbi:MAG TPA: hypothetical protein VEI02_09195 [Planctomycetota bacterium]|nr:hypothetical protein [Planctomycetota bacterium]